MEKLATVQMEGWRVEWVELCMDSRGPDSLENRVLYTIHSGMSKVGELHGSSDEANG